MRLRTHLLTAFAAIALSTSILEAHADTYTYTYTGIPFTTFDNTRGYYLPDGTLVPLPPVLVPGDSASGYFTLSSALAANLNGVALSVTSAGFKDGALTLTPGPGGYVFRVSTDALGDIDAWNIYIMTEPSYYGVFTASGEGQPTRDFAYQQATYQQGSGIDQASNTNDPGTWTEAINDVPVSNSPVPEPSTFILLATGILSLAAATIRRLPTT